MTAVLAVAGLSLSFSLLCYAWLAHRFTRTAIRPLRGWRVATQELPLAVRHPAIREMMDLTGSDVAAVIRWATAGAGALVAGFVAGVYVFGTPLAALFLSLAAVAAVGAWAAGKVEEARARYRADLASSVEAMVNLVYVGFSPLDALQAAVEGREGLFARDARAAIGEARRGVRALAEFLRIRSASRVVELADLATALELSLSFGGDMGRELMLLARDLQDEVAARRDRRQEIAHSFYLFVAMTLLLILIFVGIRTAIPIAQVPGATFTFTAVAAAVLAQTLIASYLHWLMKAAGGESS
jgi:Flp pilus assembly protein TadB